MGWHGFKSPLESRKANISSLWLKRNLGKIIDLFLESMVFASFRSRMRVTSKWIMDCNSWRIGLFDSLSLSNWWGGNRCFAKVKDNWECSRLAMFKEAILDRKHMYNALNHDFFFNAYEMIVMLLYTFVPSTSIHSVGYSTLYQEWSYLVAPMLPPAVHHSRVHVGEILSIFKRV